MCGETERSFDDPYTSQPKALADEDVSALKARTGKKLKGQIAPQKALDLILSTAQTDLLTGLQRERETFLDLKTSDQAKALRHVFFAERGAKKPNEITVEAPELDTVGVIGGGTMGAGIAYALLNSGYSVTLLETDSAGVERAAENVERIVAASLKRGLITEDGAASRRKRFQATSDYGLAQPLKLVIEAAFESMEVKETIFKKLDAIVADDAILATNTSYLDVDAIASVLKNPSPADRSAFLCPRAYHETA